MREFLAALMLCLLVAVATVWAFPMRSQAKPHPIPVKSVDVVSDADLIAALPPSAIHPVYSEPLLPVPAPFGMGWHVPRKSAEPAQLASQRLLQVASRSVGKGARDLGVRRTLWCADAINKWLASIGVRGTGSALARSFAHWGRAARPAPGVVALKPRRGGSGHVVVVKAIKGNTVIAISPNHNGRVREARYPLKVFTAFRAPAA